MATARERLASSLEILEELQRDGRRVFHTAELTRVHRDRLLANGFLQRATPGWVITANPSVRPGDSTPWYSAFWEFCARYCERRFGKRWWLSAEQSALLHGGNTAVPEQVVIHAPDAANNRLALPFGTSLFDVRDPREPPATNVEERDGLRIFAAGVALTRVSAAFFRSRSAEAPGPPVGGPGRFRGARATAGRWPVRGGGETGRSLSAKPASHRCGRDRPRHAGGGSCRPGRPIRSLQARKCQRFRGRIRQRSG